MAHLLFRFLRKEREKAIGNLSVAFGKEKSQEEILRVCYKSFENLGKGLIEVLQFPKLTQENVDRVVTFQGKSNIDDALSKGKGVIILTAHFGNWELLGASLALSGYRTNFIVRPVRSPLMDEMITRNRENMGIRCIPRGASIKKALRCLKRNELLGILSDIDTKVDGVFVDFFGRPAFTPSGPVSIALKTGATIIPVFIIRQNDDRHKIAIEEPLELEITGNRSEDILGNTARLTRLIESYIRKNPEQWIWIHERWKTKPSKRVS